MEDVRPLSPEPPPQQLQQRQGLQQLHHTLPRRIEVRSPARGGGGGHASAPTSPGGRRRPATASAALSSFQHPPPGSATPLPARSMSAHRLSRPSPLGHHVSHTVTEHWGVVDLPGFDSSLGRSTQHMYATATTATAFSSPALSESSQPMRPADSQDSLMWLTSSTSLGGDSRGMSRSDSGETASLGHHSEYPGYFHVQQGQGHQAVQGQAHHLPTIWSTGGGSGAFAGDARGSSVSSASSLSQSSTAATPGGLLAAVARAWSTPRNSNR